MPQAHLPLIPSGNTEISNLLSVTKQDGKFIYFNGIMPVFSHNEDDQDSFKMITAQFCDNGHCKQMDIVRAFGVTKVSVKRAVKKFREEGTQSFFQPRKSRGASVLTPAVLQQAQILFDQEKSISDVALELGIKKNTLSKAVTNKNLHVISKKKFLNQN